MDEWITVKEAARFRNCTERNILRLIQKGELKAKREGHRWFILKESLEQTSEESPNMSEVSSILKAQLQEKDKQIERLQKQLEEKDEQIKNLQEALAEAGHRHDTVVMQMTRLLEYHQQPFWRKLFTRKALPGPLDSSAVNRETHDNEEKNAK